MPPIRTLDPVRHRLPPTVRAKLDGGATNPDYFDDPGTQMAATLYMLDALRPEVSDLVIATPSPRARALAALDMTYPETEAAFAACLPGAAMHAEVAGQLAPVVERLM